MSIDPKKQSILEKRKNLLNNSPYWKYIRMELVDFTDEGCILQMNIGDDHLNLYNTAHGGALATLADSTCGVSLIFELAEGEYIATQNLIVNYLRPVKKGLLTGKGWIVHRGRHSALLEADIFNEAGEKVAHAQTTHVIRRTGTLDE